MSSSDSDVDMAETAGDADFDMEEMEGLEEKIQEAKQAVEADPFNPDTHAALLSLLRKNGDLEELGEARKAALDTYPLKAEQWKEWIEDERLACAGEDDEVPRVDALFQKAVSETRSAAMWIEYVQWACGQSKQIAREKFELALQSVGLRVDVGGLLWSSYLDVEEALLAGVEEGDEKEKEGQTERVRQLYRRALRVPTNDLAEIWQRYNAFEESVGSEPREEIVTAHAEAHKMMKELNGWETKLAQSENSIDVYYEYLQVEMGKGDPARVQSFLERIVDEHSGDEAAWTQYGLWAEQTLKVHSVTVDVYGRAVRYCSHSCSLWQATLLAMERAGRGAYELDSVWQTAKSTIASADDGRALFRTYIYLVRRRLDGEKADIAPVTALFEEGQKLLRGHFANEWDPQAQFRRNQAWFLFHRAGDVKRARVIWEDILASGGGRLAERWLEAVRLERQFGDVEHARRLLGKALNSVADHPYQIYEYIIQFEREEGTLEQMEKALEKVNAQAMHRSSRPQKDEKNVKKEKGAGGAAERKRPAPKEEKKQVPAKKAAVAAKPPAVKQDKRDSDGFAMPSMPAKKTEVAAPSTAGGQKAEGGENKWTVFVSNLDFKCTEGQIMEVLDGVVEVRLVYRGMSKLHKGFGFVEMKDEAAMKAALAKDRVPIAGRPMLVSENNPEKRVGFKYETGLENNKLFVRNVHYDCTPQQLTDTFSQFGEVKGVRIVTHKSGKAKGVAYVDMTTEEAASKALAAESIILLERNLSVALSNPPKKTDSAPAFPAPAAGGRIGHSSMIQLAPRVVSRKAAPKEAESGKEEKKEMPKQPMSNEQFRAMLNAGSK